MKQFIMDWIKYDDCLDKPIYFARDGVIFVATIHAVTHADPMLCDINIINVSEEELFETREAAEVYLKMKKG
jgi:hypothetical protein